MNEESKENNKPQVYIVYSYAWLGYTKHVMGVYDTPEEAVARQKDLIPNGSFGINGSRSGRDVNGNTMTTFVNVFPKGDCHIELFTTSILNWQRFIN